MTNLQSRITDQLRAILDGLDQAVGSAEAAAALDAVRDVAAQPISETADAGDTVLTSADGVQVRLHLETFASVTLQVAPNADADTPFAGLAELFTGVTADLDPAALHALVGPAAEIAYGNHTYLLDDQHQASFAFRKDGAMLRLVLLTPDPSSLRSLRRKAAKAAKDAPATASDAPPSVQSLEISDEDGILALVDVAAYESAVPDWNFESMTAHLTAEQTAGRALAWMTGTSSYGEWTVELRRRASTRPAHREAHGRITVTNGRLHLVGWEALTMAAESQSDGLAAENGHGFDVANGRYAVRVRQLFDPADQPAEGTFEVVLTKPRGKAEPAISPLWWS